MIIDRRRFLQLGSSSAAANLIPSTFAEMPQRLPIIDVHLHAYPADAPIPAAMNPITGKTVKLTDGADPSMTFHANIFGSPAIRLGDFRKAVPQTFASFHLTVNAPLGSYDRNSSVNTGANRWAFTPVVNLDITPDKGVSWLDLYAGGRFVTDNTAFRGNNRLSQNPLGVLTVHYSHNIGKRMWAGIGMHYDNGGQSFVNHIPQHDYANGFRPALIVGRRFGKFSVGLRYENTASKPNAAPTNALLSLRLSGPLYPF